MTDETVTVTVKLLEREFLVGCKPEEREGLLTAVTHLDHKMREIRQAARSPGYDRVAILAALDITHELLVLQRSRNAVSATMGDQLATLRHRLEAALEVPLE